MDAPMCAFAVFFFLYPSLLHFQRAMKAGRTVYRNSWITDKPTMEENDEHLASCGRARWKIENEHNNVLKNRGYNLNTIYGTGRSTRLKSFLS
jgi:hypothetical protein